MSKPRKIIIEVLIDWEDYEDVCDELLLEDAIEAKVEGVSWNILTKQNHEQTNSTSTVDR